jgi:nitrogenase molybdenum-iron protein alpha/beta subunit
MADYTITITDTELTALSTVMADPQEWAEHNLKERARLAMKPIIDSLIEHCNNNEIAIAVGKDAQIAQAQTLGLIHVVDGSSPHGE